MSTPANVGASLGVMLPPGLPGAQFRPFVERCVRLGFDELWVVEDLGYHGGFGQAAAALAMSTGLQVGVGVLPSAARHVAFTAMETATLAEIFPGRLTVGIGHGMPDWMRQIGVWPSSPLTLMEEYVTALRALLRGGPVTVTGRYIDLKNVALQATAAQPPLILAGVRGAKSLELAGRVADGTILAEPVTPEYLRVARRQLNAGSGHQVVAYNVAAVDADPRIARGLVRAALGVVGDPAWEPHIRPLPFADDLALLRARCATRKEFSDRLPDDWIDQLAITGTPETARERIGALRAAGADRVVLSPAGPDPLHSLTALGRLVQ